VDGIAVVSAIFAATDIKRETEKLLKTAKQLVE